ncbi:trifunctional transcriptional regulator/proline dehydrogenase/L-glutamate gamma-semialdehyde dehydrogenase [Roseomonas mucosa]|uniref:trifunctional transcriptional regulator/proline dehydrogenase/L-glutamate gamma-semialdehyde dehydrogenase n=1 Tax=Roseomonas mucosa TaxID=207340 RepID=UPI0028CC4BB9|nr:trifunctional transcriptional regulator/proline dehydrogenase/L-glutamate gamma-semialdehyde dehydrogenase [Roseomonas mucosa]MDT8275233.1 trifunctional transcriptional regulator/proline dehydrogenase/L-glutamate gamma-semialdehyde dehydrogenase [Roseomonas mucosa]
MSLAARLDMPSAAPIPFDAFAASVQAQGPLRAAITRHERAAEPGCIARLLPDATLPAPLAARAAATATRLVEALRRKGTRGAVEGLVQEFSLSSQEGVALMCLAEALLRIPDTATRDALIRDKIGGGDWRSHLGHSPSLFVNAATWGLVVTGRLATTSSETGLSHALTRLIARGGEPVIRKGVDLAMRMMGEQFVTGQTIAEALVRARKMEAKGFRYSYDMLGEAATTAADAERYHRDYETAIHAIGQAAAGRGIYEGPGISIKLSALHPRYARAQRDRVMAELLPRVALLAGLAKRYDIGLNIDAEEADRLDLSLDILEALCLDPALAGWDGLGFVVQAYQKRAPFVLDFVIDLARRSGHRLMVRLVKGAYWDSEIKRAQIDGLEDFPVFTRKRHTDVSYLACARKLLEARDAVFPQFATHNAQTLASIHTLAGEGFRIGDHEFQCLHGMGEPLYEEVVGPGKLDRPCRIYAPVGTHETLLAYLVRRLLENGANSSFVNRIQDPAVTVEALAADPAAQVAAEQPPGAPNPHIALPRGLFGAERVNSLGLNLSNEAELARLATALRDSAAQDWRAAPLLAGMKGQGLPRPVLNPANHRDRVGMVVEASAEAVGSALHIAAEAAAAWAAEPPEARAACLSRAADLLEQRMPLLLGLLVREAGKSFANAVAEVREAVDFLRYYGAQVRRDFRNGTHRPLGPVLCISPWNFPLAIFTGQVAAALAAGNPVIAKPAEETPLIAAQSVAILHEAGVPARVLQLLPGDGQVGAALVADARIHGVMFTGSTEVARRIQAELAKRLNPGGAPVPLIAETGGQNALVVDSSALAEQVVGDVLVSAFDSAGQRCSALRVLCLQEDVADRVLAMLRGALAELSTGNPERLSTDIGPVITGEARDGILAHIEAMRAAGYPVHQSALPEECRHGTFVPPTIIEIDSLEALTREVFGPVLHVLRFRRDGIEALMRAVNATGYGLTFGVHSRIDETIQHVTALARAGNVYVNRNLVGAVVGVQPFGGHGLSGTGPKAGGPLYLRRLLAARPASTGLPAGTAPAPLRAPLRAWAAWLAGRGEAGAAAEAEALAAITPAGLALELPGPVGERNAYATEPRGSVLCHAADAATLHRAVSAALAAGNRALIAAGGTRLGAPLPPALAAWVREAGPAALPEVQAVLFGGTEEALKALAQQLASLDGPIVPVHVADAQTGFPAEFLLLERSVSTNTAAAGGNAKLMMLG